MIHVKKQRLSCVYCDSNYEYNNIKHDAILIAECSYSAWTGDASTNRVGTIYKIWKYLLCSYRLLIPGCNTINTIAFMITHFYL